MRTLNPMYLDVTPKREPGPLSWDEHDDTSGPACRSTSPYRVGDVVKFMDGDKIKDALIVRVGSKFVERRHEWRPVYTVRLRNKSGSWAKLWRRASPGDIERGFGAWDVHLGCSLRQVTMEAALPLPHQPEDRRRRGMKVRRYPNKTLPTWYVTGTKEWWIVYKTASGWKIETGNNFLPVSTSGELGKKIIAAVRASGT